MAQPLTANEQIRDALVRRGKWLERYTNSVVAGGLDVLGDVRADILSQIQSKLPGVKSQKGLERLLTSLDHIIDKFSPQFEAYIDGFIYELIDYEVPATATAIKNVIPAPAAAAFGLVTTQQVYAAIHAQPFAKGGLLNEYYAGLSTGNKAVVRGSIRSSFLEGDSIPQAMSRLRGTKQLGYRDGAWSKIDRDAEGIVRTALAHTSAVARSQLYRENSDLIAGEQWVAIRDNRLCAICAQLDGQWWPLDKPHPKQPIHFNDRCDMTSILKSYKQMGIKAEEIPNDKVRMANNGKVPDRETADH
ncbi:MAG: hypothetical protein GY774_29145, partial [Planctomycetes bacterium]|nr:hypothetical protein [Planctomycetota bacterium]